MKSASDYVYGGNWVLEKGVLQDTTPPRRAKRMLQLKKPPKDPLTFVLDCAVIGFFIVVATFLILSLA